jgi:hypothetical protein
MLHRRDFCKALVIAPAVTAAPMLMRSAFADEVSSIVMVSQHGLPYLLLMVIRSKAGMDGLPDGAKITYNIISDRGKESAGNLLLK